MELSSGYAWTNGVDACLKRMANFSHLIRVSVYTTVYQLRHYEAMVFLNVTGENQSLSYMIACFCL